MSTTSDFSRRFFAEFIAARVRAWRLEGGTRRSGRIPPDGPDADPGGVEARPADPSDRPRGRFSGLGSSGG